MFEFLRGGISTAEEGKRSKLALRTQQAISLILVGVPLAATIYALVRLSSGWLTWKDLSLLVSFYLATGLGITVGFHRLVTHRSFETNPIVKSVLLIFGTWSVQGAAITWSAIHSKHHVYSDTDEDPHSPLKSFLHAHMGWFFTADRADPERFAKAQLKDPVIMFFSRTAFWWAVLGLALPYFIGGWSGFIWGGLVRIFLVHHVTWSVNSICHTIGRRPFRIGKDRSTNNWLVGLLGMGEGWHNNHHAFPKSAFHGLSWKQIDLSGQLIRAMGWVRLAKDVYRVPKAAIEAKKAAAAAGASALLTAAAAATRRRATAEEAAP